MELAAQAATSTFLTVEGLTASAPELELAIHLSAPFILADRTRKHTPPTLPGRSRQVLTYKNPFPVALHAG